MIRFNLLFSFFLCLALNYSSTNFGVGVGISCLEKKPSESSNSVFYKDLSYVFPSSFPKNGRKFILIHDQHDFQDEENHIVRQQRNEMLGLISTLSKHQKPVSFYIEYPFLAKNFRDRLSPETVTHLPMCNALQHKFKNGSIRYKSFDHRPEDYFWVREMLLNTAAVCQHLQTNSDKMPREFFEVTVKSYFNNLLKDKDNATGIIKQWNQKLQNVVQKKLKGLQDIQSANDQKYNHMLELIMNLQGKDKAQYFLKHTEAQCVYSDIKLCDAVIKDENPISVVHAGAYHTMQLEEKLKAIGYADAFKKDLKNGLSVQSLNRVEWPENPSMHLNEIKKFLSDSK